MKVREVRTRLLEHPGARLVRDGTTPPLGPGARGRRQLLVEVATESGTTGFAVGYAPPGAREVVESALAPALRGRDASIVGELWAELMWIVRDYGRGGVALQAISAVDVALWDLRARVRGEPLHRTLGEVRPDVAVYGSGGFTSEPPETVLEEMRGFAAAGFGAVKMKVGTEFGTREEEDLERVRVVVDTLGPAVELYVDANGAYGVEQAVRMSERFAELGVRLFEEPVPAHDVRGLAEVNRRGPLPVASGEHEYEAAGLRRLAEAGAADVLQPDVLRIGGISGWRQAAAVAAEFDLSLMSHAAQLVSLHAGCATPGFAAAEYMTIQVELDRLWYHDVPEPRDGRWAPPMDRAGLGVELRDDAGGHCVGDRKG